MAIVRPKYKLPREDCEEIVNDTLLAWHRKLLTADGVASDRAFCEAVLRTEAIERLRRKSVQTGELSAAESLGVDSELEVQAGEREEIADLRELATAVLKPLEHETSVLVADGVARRSVAEHPGLTLRQVKRLRAPAQAKLNAARAVLREHGHCQMLALTIADLAEGRVEPRSKRWTAAQSHLPRCRRCRRDLASMIRSRGDRRQRPNATAAGPQGHRSQQATSTGPTHPLQQSPEMEGQRARERRVKEQSSRQAVRPTPRRDLDLNSRRHRDIGASCRNPRRDAPMLPSRGDDRELGSDGADGRPRIGSIVAGDPLATCARRERLRGVHG